MFDHIGFVIISFGEDVRGAFCEGHCVNGGIQPPGFSGAGSLMRISHVTFSSHFSTYSNIVTHLIV